ncbi:MAG: diheme cytochrome c-553 [Saprospiraceae bacterium]|nr:diheme cytochrome c-553 [Saprospiraceae bacterium]
MKSYLLILFFGITIFMIDCQSENMEPQVQSVEDLGTRGEYLVTILGCNDCHTPKLMTDRGPVPDQTRLLAGYPSGQNLPPVNDHLILKDYALFSQDLTATIGPWGTSFAANLTPDPTGLGNWTFANFERVFREGKFKGLENGRPILPPMPWQNLQKITPEDLNAIWTYLRSIPPVKNTVPVNIAPQSQNAE